MADHWTGGYCLRDPVILPRDDSWGSSSREDPSTPHVSFLTGESQPMDGIVSDDDTSGRTTMS